MLRFLIFYSSDWKFLNKTLIVSAIVARSQGTSVWGAFSPLMGLPRWLSGKDTWVGKIPWRRKWQPTPIFLPGKFCDRGAWWATVHGVRKVWTWLNQLSTAQHMDSLVYIYLEYLKNLQCSGSNVASLFTIKIKFKMALMFRNYCMQYFYIVIFIYY